MSQSRLGRVVVAPLILPHELAHALIPTIAGYSWTIHVLPDWDGAGTPLGQFDMVVDDTTPLWVIRLAALAPLPLYLSVAVLLGVFELGGAVALAAILFCAFSGTLSGGDLAVATQPAAARASGEFVVTPAGWERTASDVLTAATTVVIALLIIG